MTHRQHRPAGTATFAQPQTAGRRPIAPVKTAALASAALIAASLLAMPALAQTSSDSASGQLSAPARAVLQQGADPVSLQSLPWVAGASPARPRARAAAAATPYAPPPSPQPALQTPFQSAAQSASQSASQPARPPNPVQQTLDQQILDQQAPAQGKSAAPAANTPPFLPVEEPVLPWTVGDAQALVRVISQIGAEGLLPADYQPEALQRAIEQGVGPALDEQASRSFDWLAEDLRDGRTPMAARDSWFILDTDQDVMPTAQLLAQALATHDVPGILAALTPTYPDYAQLKAALAATAPGADAQADAIRINMDRWRWLPRDLGKIYLITNVPEYQLRLTVGGRIIRNYKTIVGKPGRTATPQLAARVQSVVFYPTWTVPQSIIEHEHLDDKIAAKPAWAAAQGYTVTRLGDGSVTIVQQPGAKNSLGEMKIDMPNPHAIYMHDTNTRYLFDRPVRAFSHGCVRVEKAVELGMTMAILSKSRTVEQTLAIYNGHKNTRVPMAQTFPAYITYFTVAVDVNGQLTRFTDLYNRDPAVLASFAGPRALHTNQRTSDSEVIVAADPL